jgi:hypothetical protein
MRTRPDPVPVLAMMSLAQGAAIPRNEAARHTTLVVRFRLFNYCFEKYRTRGTYFSLCTVHTHELRDAKNFAREVDFCSTVEKLSYYVKVKLHDRLHKILPLHPS